MVGHGGSSAGSYLADPTSPIPSHCASIVATSTVRVNLCANILNYILKNTYDRTLNIEGLGRAKCCINPSPRQTFIHVYTPVCGMCKQQLYFATMIQYWYIHIHSYITVKKPCSDTAVVSHYIFMYCSKMYIEWLSKSNSCPVCSVKCYVVGKKGKKEGKFYFVAAPKTKIHCLALLKNFPRCITWVKFA